MNEWMNGWMNEWMNEWIWYVLDFPGINKWSFSLTSYIIILSLLVSLKINNFVSDLFKKVY